MSARQLSRLARAKGLDPLLGGVVNVESEESGGSDDSEEEDERFLQDTRRAGVVSASAFGDDSDESSSSEEDEERQDQEWSGCDRNDGPSTNTTAGDSVVVDNDEDITTASPTTCSQEPLSATKKERRPAPVSTFKSGGSATVADTSTKAQKVEEVQDDDEYLDKIISQLATEAAAGGGGLSAADLPRGASSPLAKFLRCDARCLKLDVELRRMFGAGVGGGGGDRENAGAAGGGRARRTRRGMVVRGSNVPASLALKRLVISAPKEDWPKPPSLVGGGLGMSRCAPPKYLPQWQLEAHQGAEWFVFERSESLEQLQRRFEAIQGMHDPNLLAAFASRAPYHADALLQLAMVFAHTGQMDRSAEFIGRSLYVLESAFSEAFRPVEGASRVDTSLEVNKTYLAAMFRHMQMAGMVGGARTALEVGRLLLSLDPLGDPMGCLLALDSYALTSRQGEFILELHRSRLPIGFSPAMIARNSAGNGALKDPDVTVQDLPGLSMSMCLALLDTTNDVGSAREAMASTLLRFPVMLEPLLEKSGLSPRSTTYPHDWKSVMQHSHFGGAKNRLPRGHVLLHLASIFSQRHGEIWKHDRAQELLYDGAGIALQGLGTSGDTVVASGAVASSAESGTSSATPAPCSSLSETDTLQRAYGSGSPIHKYLDLALADFDEAFALLPQDANILDPRLMGPNFMNERVRLRMPGGEGGGRGRGQDVLDEVLAMAVQADGRQDAGIRRAYGWDRRGRRAAGGVLGNLNPESPLAQLLWQTLLPWNVFPTPSRPPPPPPR